MKSQIKIKTLEEIQNEKRQRSLAANDSNAKSQISEQVQTKVVENKPTIAPRRIKLKPNKSVAVINKSPVKLKRTSALLDDSGRNQNNQLHNSSSQVLINIHSVSTQNLAPPIFIFIGSLKTIVN